MNIPSALLDFPPVSPITPPGTIIHHLNSQSNCYIGSPSIAILSDGSYVASHDIFGPGSTEHQYGETSIFRSFDRGISWKLTSRVEQAFWSGLFVIGKDLYLLGTTFHHGLLAIRRSIDGGETWTTPCDEQSGLLTATG